jgi:Bacteriophage baseplate protein W
VLISSPIRTGREHLGQGWRFPIQPDGLGRLGFSRAEKDIEEAIWLIVSTSPGERQMLPKFGCALQDLVFRPAEEVRSVAGTLVRQALVRWEPRIDVIDVVARPEEGQPNLVLVHITYRVRSTNSVGNLVYPFWLGEAT